MVQSACAPIRVALVWLAVGVGVTATQLGVGQSPDTRFGAYRTFRCQLGDGDGRVYRPGAAAENRRGDGFSDDIIFDDINYSTRAARVIGSAGGDDASILNGTLAVTFVEATPFGGSIITTIDKRALSPGRFRAAMSKQVPLTTGDFNATQF